jgi:Fe-S cluster assembly ATP-binding protein
MFDGRIVRSGGPELAEKLEAEGYDWVKEETPALAQA